MPIGDIQVRRFKITNERAGPVHREDALRGEIERGKDHDGHSADRESRQAGVYDRRAE